MEAILGLIGFIIFWYVAMFVIGGIGILLEKAGLIDLSSDKTNNKVHGKESSELKSNTSQTIGKSSSKDLDELLNELETLTKKKEFTPRNRYIKPTTNLTPQKTYTKPNTNDKILNKYNIKYIYHMTHVNNLKNILIHGLLSHGNNAVKNKIDNPEVNNRRTFIEPIYRKNVHSYVPFYFNPRNPMLYVNKENQNNLAILVFDNSLIYETGSVFTDGNASVNGTSFYNNLNDLNKLNWKCLRSKYWNDFQDGKRLIMAEVLVPNKVNISKLKKIYCIDYKIKRYIENLMNNYPHVTVEVNKEVFF